MSTVHEISQVLWLETPKGKATAKFMLDYGPEADLMWVCVQEATGEIWTWANWDVRACDNISLGRESHDKEESVHICEPPDHRQERPVGDPFASYLSALGEEWQTTLRESPFDLGTK